MARLPEENARTVAVDTLCHWEERHLPIDRIFTEKAAGLDPTERRLARSIVYGILRQRDTLDAVLTSYSSHPPSKMKSRTLMTLRAGIYQLFFLSRIPSSAAVNATVNTLKRARQPSWMVGFANGVLRRIAGERESLAGYALDRAGLPRTNHPEWLCARWEKQYGKGQMRAICAINNSEPSLTLRVNTRKIGRTDFLAELKKSGVKVQPSRISPVGLVVDGYPGPVHTLHGYEAGLFQVQDDGAQLISMLVADIPGAGRVLDACAGLGGKTGHLVELLPAGSTVLALEPDRFRQRLLLENIQRLGHGSQVMPVQGTVAEFVQTRPQPFDAILIDAPCSGTGVIRRQPDIRWNRQPGDLPKLAAQQLALMQQASAVLKPGGLMVYATCSLEAEENMEVVERFLGSNSAFTLEPAGPHLPEQARSFVREKGSFSTLPTDGCDGFFSCCLRRAL
ncbi:MAG: 16S rRNA (cytosine(967)-C(5))-methyltransferase RsmB [Desulfobulbaceae bacterium]|nr:16S rRNA (cytosine(967)-C(5))-methyltransferase RsmB [Desulfobulbaceae bacterium]